MFQNLVQQFVPKQHTLKPQLFSRCGFEARYYFNFGDYCDPRHQLPISIVVWRLPPTQQLKQSEHPNVDIITYVLKGRYRQDNILEENQQLKEGQAIQYISGNNHPWHRDSNSHEDVSEIVQIFAQNITEERQTTQLLYSNDQIISNQNYYKMQILSGNQTIENKDFKYLIILNLDEQLLINDQKYAKFDCRYYEEQTIVKIEGSQYLVIQI